MEAGKELRFGDWSLREIDMINEVCSVCVCAYLVLISYVCVSGFIFDRQACCFPCEHEREELRHQKEQASCRSADLVSALSRRSRLL